MKTATPSSALISTVTSLNSFYTWRSLPGACCNLIISLIRQNIPNRIRIVVQLVVVATLVTIVSQVLKAYVYDVSVALSVYVGLIITNCILIYSYSVPPKISC
mgnify:CR=1 FL=1